MPTHANYLPDEILLEVLAYISAWDTRPKQSTLATFCAVNRYMAALPKTSLQVHAYSPQRE
jgi:hypothetical protein